MTIHDPRDEYLEILYCLQERPPGEPGALEGVLASFSPEVSTLAATDGLVTANGEAGVHLTPKGLQRAEQIIRRHRLGERLLSDVLHMSSTEVEAGACEFEHVLADEIVDSICILLGHPRTCPHGSPIPAGACCRAAVTEVRSAIVPLTEAPIAKWVKVSYVRSLKDERQHRLAHFGVAPGQLVKVHQLRPSVIVVLGDTRLAMEQSIAESIFVWNSRDESNVLM